MTVSSEQKPTAALEGGEALGALVPAPPGWGGHIPGMQVAMDRQMARVRAWDTGGEEVELGWEEAGEEEG